MWWIVGVVVVLFLAFVWRTTP